MTAIVYMVAGLSSRFGGKIKQFAEVGPNNETFIECSINQALPAGFDKIIFIVGEKTLLPFKEKFRDSYRDIPVFYALQYYNQEERDRPWGTTDALCSALPLLKESFVVCNGDDIYGKESFKILYNHLQKCQEDITLGYILKDVLPDLGSVNRGIFKTKNHYVTNIREVFGISRLNLNEINLTLENMCSMNIFGLHPETVEKLKNILKSFKDKNKRNRTVECLLPVEISNLIQSNQIKMKIYPTNDKWLGITNPEDEITIREILKKQV